MQKIMAASPMQTVAWFIPMSIGGFMVSVLVGKVLHLVPGTLILLAAGAASVLAPLLFALAPVGANYWTFVFPAMICGTLSIDLTFVVSTVHMSTSQPLEYQALAGARIRGGSVV